MRSVAMPGRAGSHDTGMGRGMCYDARAVVAIAIVVGIVLVATVVIAASRWSKTAIGSLVR